ncbi:uncharacterized protein METZ01_LOCUS227344 [marine metagenome]|uniref:Uncharacterized protein n=1 Tax=marine metagenome TaxID=408172 RepID=A0A382GH43_9ZZZZ
MAFRRKNTVAVKIVVYCIHHSIHYDCFLVIS